MSRTRREKHKLGKVKVYRAGWSFGAWHLFYRENYRGDCCECWGCNEDIRMVGYLTDKRMKPVRRDYFRKSRGWR